MKANLASRLLLAALLALPSTSFPADTKASVSVDHQLAKLREQNEKDLAAAEATVSRRYRQSLEKLLQAAIRANDLPAAKKIKAVLAMQPQELALELAGTWKLTASTGYDADVTLRMDGTGTHSGYGHCRWRVRGVTLYIGPGDRDDQFFLPIKDGTLHGLNHLGNGLSMVKQDASDEKNANP